MARATEQRMKRQAILADVGEAVVEQFREKDMVRCPACGWGSLYLDDPERHRSECPLARLLSEEE